MLKVILDNNDTFSFPDEGIIFINVSQNVKINASTSKVHTHRIHMKLRSIAEFTGRIQYNDIRMRLAGRAVQKDVRNCRKRIRQNLCIKQFPLSRILADDAGREAR